MIVILLVGLLLVVIFAAFAYLDERGNRNAVQNSLKTGGFMVLFMIASPLILVGVLAALAALVWGGSR